MQDIEAPGAFYLGRPYDLATRSAAPAPLMYDSRDLLTHAVCIGMTGSGKTGLGVGLLEEALIDGVPAIIIDPKGDLGNLALTFPGLSGAEFAPWVNEEDARRAGLSVEDYAAREAEKWRTGLESWQQGPERIERLRAAADVAIYTPGSTAGRPVSILRSFDAPPQAVLEDRELLRERVSTTATSLLGLVGIDADPLQSREHILISTIFEAGWMAGDSVDLATLIQRIQTPPMERVGALSLDAFYPEKDRFGLATALNNLLAAPGFDLWLMGEALDISALLRTKEGRPRAAIFSIAHLSDAERMFFVALLLNEVLGWVRLQSGTTSLRALLYMDEIFGYFPPVANPPSKEPLLLLLKQARAFGLGVVLATQNPVDLDYKGLSNTGTWFIGRLQTERDKARVLEGLEGAGAGAIGFDRARMEQVLAGLGHRVFLMHNVHEDAPITFETRWVLSYLRGPLTRAQIRQLTPRSGIGSRESAFAKATADKSGIGNRESTFAKATADKSGTGLVGPALRAGRLREAAIGDPGAGRARSPSGPHDRGTSASGPPLLPPGISQLFLPARAASPDVVMAYEPALYGAAAVRITDRTRKIDETMDVAVLVPLHEGAMPAAWDAVETVEVAPDDLEAEPRTPATFGPLPAAATKSRSYDQWRKGLATWLYDQQAITLLEHTASGEHSLAGETEGVFRTRLLEHLRAERDARVDALKKKFASKVSAQQERIRRAEQQVGKQEQEASQSTTNAVLTGVTGVFGALFGRKTFSAANAQRVGTVARGAGRVVKDRQDITRARETLAAERQKLAELQATIESDVTAIGEATRDAGALAPLVLRPKKTGITVHVCSLVWVPKP